MLGWIGSSKDITLLSELLISDPDSRCRAWAATAFMQQWFRNNRPSFIDKALPSLRKAIDTEKDLFTLGCYIMTVQTITKKRFGLSDRDIDNEDKQKIEDAKLKVERFFNKLYKNG